MRVDLHLHTTASDGRSSPADLVDLCAANGVAVIAVTDHDTTAAVTDVQALARARGIEAVSGIEITAVDEGRDVHVLGYFIDTGHPGLQALLATARANRVSRVEAITDRLAAHGLRVDMAPILAAAQRQSGKSIGRPLIADALVQAGHVKDRKEAFDRWLANDGPAFVARVGASPEEVIGAIHAAGGLASLAHPGRTRIDHRIDALVNAGLDALEVFHVDHESELVESYSAVARRFGLLVTGGSDFHGDTTHGRAPGTAGPPGSEWERLSAARTRHAIC